MAFFKNIVQDYKDWKNYGNLKESECETESFPYIKYVGNGGFFKKGGYHSIFEKKHINGKEILNNNSENGEYAIQYLSGRKVIMNGFIHRDGQFCGFFLRKKDGEYWVWYTESGKWQRTLADMEPKKLFKNNENISDLVEKERMAGTECLVFQAQWKSKNSNKYLNKGYEMFSNPLVAHALGGLEDKIHLNTRSAFEHAIQNGYQYFETDLSFTEDGRLVLCHGWSERDCEKYGIEYSSDFEHMTYERIKQLSIYGETVMDAGDLYDYMQKYPNIKIMIDLHGYMEDNMSLQIKALLEEMHHEQSVLNRLMIQIYNYKMFEEVEKVYSFPYYQLMVGKDIKHVDKQIEFCLDHGICAIALRFNMTIPEYVKQIKNAGLSIESYTVKDNLSLANLLLDIGADTICTDFISPDQLKNQKKPADFSMDHYPIQIYYHSGNKEAKESYSSEIENGKLHGKAAYLKSGNIEFQDADLWKNDGTETLKKNRFSVEGKQFIGWKMRIVINEKTLWYCDDDCWRFNSDFTEDFEPRPYIFSDEEVIPEWMVRKNQKFVMVAVWE